VVKFVSKNAYILIALKGRSFCASARAAFFLILSNIKQVAVNALVTGLVLNLAKLTITCGCGAAALYTFAAMGEELSSPMLPVLFVLLLAWSVASGFMGVYGLAVDTIMVRGSSRSVCLAMQYALAAGGAGGAGLVDVKALLVPSMQTASTADGLARSWCRKLPLSAVADSC
jgi:hypothetical protein